MRSLYFFYFRRVLPVIGRLISRHRDAYTYLPDSVLAFPGPDELAARIRNQGFRDVSYRLVFGGDRGDSRGNPEMSGRWSMVDGRWSISMVPLIRKQEQLGYRRMKRPSTIDHRPSTARCSGRPDLQRRVPAGSLRQSGQAAAHPVRAPLRIARRSRGVVSAWCHLAAGGAGGPGILRGALGGHGLQPDRRSGV